MNFRYPIFLDLTGKKCVVTGEGFEVAAKVRGLAEACADIRYINPQAVAEIEALASAGTIRWERRDFAHDDLDGCFLVVTCSPRNAEIFRMAEARNVLCNAVDDPANCRYSYGSIHRSGDLTIGISTNGTAPAVAVRLKQRFQREIGPEYGELLAELRRLRPEITSCIADFEKRKQLWYSIADSEALSLLKSGDREAAFSVIRHLIDQAVSST
ncbi:MAG: bifunctional precorrin-2 dehydrogenase/sirohydrochlorin ferrochelatase [Bryobacteraceae bacterium]